MTQVIKGYRNLNQEEINLINLIKDKGSKLEELINDLQDNIDLDQRWVSLACTHFQQGLMAAVRAVAQPETF